MSEQNDSKEDVNNPRDYSHFQIITARSSKWSSVRLLFITANPVCKCCGKKNQLEVHHIIPVHVDPQWELAENNLITLCERCHLVVGHLNDWMRHNKCVIQDSETLRSRHDATDV